jgi:hypothetical protein
MMLWPFFGATILAAATTHDALVTLIRFDRAFGVVALSASLSALFAVKWAAATSCRVHDPGDYNRGMATRSTAARLD